MTEKTLLPFIIRRAPIVLFLKIVWVMVLSDILFLITAFAGDAFSRFSDDLFFNIVAYDTGVFVVLIILQLLFSFWLFLRWFSEYYKIDLHTITFHKGILFPYEEKHMVDKVETVTFQQNLWGRVFEYGDIKVSFIGGKDNFHLFKITNPRQIVYLIEHRREE
ncbi:PH domain-containing protein [Candidatus Gracilibacteria bacterium]|nr:PH domain-containing protein [Candidatus Gracilibacteria bacterium]